MKSLAFRENNKRRPVELSFVFTLDNKSSLEANLLKALNSTAVLYSDASSFHE